MGSKSAAAIAAQIIDGSSPRDLAYYVSNMEAGAQSAATQAARVLEDVAKSQPELAAPHIAALVTGLLGERQRVAQACARVLPALTRSSPAKVAKQLPTLLGAYQEASPTAQDGLVHVFAGLCRASITYQTRVIHVVESALRAAGPDHLQRWSELLLPTLKGEPHAQARAVVEGRLYEIPRPVAQRIAAALGLKLRPARA